MLSKEFAKIYPQLKDFADKIYKQNFTTDDILADLYIYLVKNESKIDINKLKAFCDKWIWNTCYFNKIDKTKKYNNSNEVTFEDYYYDVLIQNDNENDDQDKILYEKLIIISKKLKTKNPKLYRYFEMYYLNDYTIKEISQYKGVSIGIVHYYIKEILNFIKQRI